MTSHVTRKSRVFLLIQLMTVVWGQSLQSLDENGLRVAEIIKPDKEEMMLLNSTDDVIHKISCTAIGHPQPKIMWLHNGQLILASFMTEDKEKVDSVVQFMAAQLSPDFLHVYTCIASNDLATDQFDFTVQVESNEINYGTKIGKRISRETHENPSGNKTKDASTESKSSDVLLIVLVVGGGLALIIFGVAWRVYCFQKCLNHK